MASEFGPPHIRLRQHIPSKSSLPYQYSIRHGSTHGRNVNTDTNRIIGQSQTSLFAKVTMANWSHLQLPSINPDMQLPSSFPDYKSWKGSRSRSRIPEGTALICRHRVPTIVSGRMFLGFYVFQIRFLQNWGAGDRWQWQLRTALRTAKDCFEDS